MGIFFRRYVLLILLLLLQGKAVAQEAFDEVLEESIDRVTELLDSSNFFLQKNINFYSYQHIPGFLYFSGNVLSENNSALSDNYFTLKEKYLTSDLGLRVVGNYNNNLSGGFSEDEEIYYNQRTYLGVEWNVLETGSIGNRKKLASLKNEKEINDIRFKENNLKKDYLFTRQYVTASFIHAQNPYLKQRLDVLWGLYDIYQKLFYLKRVDWERLLKVKGEIKKVELILKRNERILKNSGFEMPELLRVDGMPIFSIDGDAILKEIPLEAYDSLRYALKTENIENDYEAYIDKVSVRPYIRYNFYDFLSTNARSYPSLGVSFNLPVSKASGKRDLVKIEKEMLSDAYVQDKDEIFSDVLDLTREYEDRIQDFVYLVYQRDLLKEKIRRELRKREISLMGFNGVQALSHFDEFLDFESEILDKKMDIYLKLLDICHETRGENPENFLVELGYDLSYKNFPGNRGVYLWSDLFNVMNNDHLISFMSDREINWVLVSLGKGANDEKLVDFFDDIKYFSIKGIGLVGNNELVNQSEERILNYLDRFKRFNMEGLHLDVEPHVFDDYKAEENAYQEKLLTLYAISSKWCQQNNFSLSVSIPFHYSAKFVEQAMEVCDRVFIMNYGSKNDSQMAQRMKKFVTENNKDRLVVSIRPSDFESINTLDFSLLHLIKASGVNSFCFSDLRGLNRMTSDFVPEEGDAEEYRPYRVEAGNFKSAMEAQSLSDLLTKRGYSGEITWKRNGTYCVVLGYFNNFDMALTVLNKYQEKRGDLPESWIYMVH